MNRLTLKVVHRTEKRNSLLNVKGLRRQWWASVLTSVGLLAVLPSSASCTYTIDSEWNTGFTASIALKNETASTINGWTVNWKYSSNTVASGWNATITGANPYTATNLSWNSAISPGQTISFGFQGVKNSSTVERPTVSGSLCAIVTSSSSVPSSSISSVSSTSSSSKSSSSSTSSSSSMSNNFAQNGDVESGLTNWGVTGGSILRTTADKHAGTASALISNRTAAWNGLTFNPGTLTLGNQYLVSVWVKLTLGTPDTVITLTGKRVDDADTSTYNEYARVATLTASASEWRKLEGYYTYTGNTAFQNFIIESSDSTASYFADDFAISGIGVTGSSSSSSSSSSAASSKKFVGNITTSGAVRTDFVKYWNQITPENEGKWGSVERTRGVYDWSALDKIYAYARQNNIPVKAHTFVWGSQYPSWITNLSAAEQAVAIEDWIRNYCTRYPDTKLIDVVNEAIPSHAPAAYAKNAFGDNWIIKSFQLARKYCPNSVLILNDYNVLSWNTADFIALAKPLIAAGVVDALGEQAHGLEAWTAADISSKLNQVAALGLPIYITEYDVAKTDDQAQLQIMQAQFPIFYNSPYVKGITLWGYVYGKTWVTGSGLIQDDGTARPAMTWLMNYIGR